MSKRDDSRPTSPYGSPDTSAPHSSGARKPPRSESPDLPDYVVRDIVAYVQQALGRFATPGEVRFEGAHLYLEGTGQELSPRISISAWSGDWGRMDEALRRRRAEDVARSLSRDRWVAASGASLRRTIYLDPKLLFALALLVLCGFWIAFGDAELPKTPSNDRALREATTSGSPAPSSAAEGEVRSKVGTPSLGEDLGEARSSRVCGATLTRIFQGGSVSVADIDGFRVEIALLQMGGKRPLENHPALARFVQDPNAATGSRFIWEKELGLASVETSDSVVVVRRMALGEGEAHSFGVTLSFGGSLVDAYFKEAERSRFSHIASALADAVEATHVAVYARCFDRPLHALGSWFRGVDTGAAITSLVYFMGTYARPPHLAKPYYQLPGEQEMNRLHAFKSIADKTAPLTRTDLATLLGDEGGMATGRPGEPVIITFPFGDGNRAARASRSIVRVAGLGGTDPG